MTTSATPDWHRRWLGAAEMVSAKQVFFVVGCQKSGTTWVQKLLNAHPQIACQGESHFCDTLVRLVPAILQKYNTIQSETNRIEEGLLLSDDDLRSIMKVLFDRMLARYIESKTVDAESISAVGDKTPEHANAIPFLRGLFPCCRFVHVIRDGRDAAVSGWAHLQRVNKSGEFAGFADYAEYFARRHWVPYITNARNCGSPLGDDYFEIRYEVLHEHPHVAMHSLLNMLDVDADVKSVQHCVTTASFAALSGGRSIGQEDPESHYRKGVVGDWRRAFDADATARFNEAAGAMLRELGYEVVEPAAKPGAIA